MLLQKQPESTSDKFQRVSNKGKKTQMQTQPTRPESRGSPPLNNNKFAVLESEEEPVQNSNQPPSM